MPSIYQPRRPRASPLWQLLTAAWETFLACHQRRVRQTADWIATAVCHEVPHRQFVFTIPKILRGIFRKRRDLLHLLFKTATEILQEIFRKRLNLPDGKLGAIAAVHTFVGRHHPAPMPTAASFRHRNHGAYRAALASNQRMDPRRRTESRLVQLSPESIRSPPRLVRPDANMEST